MSSTPWRAFPWKNRYLGRAASVLLFGTLWASAPACSANADDAQARPNADDVDGGTEPEASDDDDDAPRPKDAGTDAKTTAPADILGTLSGSCGKVKTLLAKATPSFEKNNLVFVEGETYEGDSLSADGERMFDTPNAGGSSTESEVMSFEVLHACEGAALLKTETEILYTNDDAGPPSITDILVEIAGKKVGVSVTRAYKPANIAFPDSDVKALLEKKLEGILRSSARVAPADRWVKQILHVFAATKAQADAVTRVLPTIDAELRSNTIVLLTETKGGGFVYCDPDPPLGSECP